MFSLVILSVSIAANVFSVSVSYGACYPNSKFRSAFKLAFFIGFFQFFMSSIGWFAGMGMGNILSTYGTYIASVVLAIIGIKMLADIYIKSVKGVKAEMIDITHWKQLFVICFATSINALAAGFSLNLLYFHLLFSVSFIGLITFSLSLAGVQLGKTIGLIPGKWAQIIGGIILIGMSVKFIVEKILIK